MKGMRDEGMERWREGEMEGGRDRWIFVYGGRDGLIEIWR